MDENRRRFLKQAGAVGAAAWAAPMITTAAHAGTPAGTACEDCTGRGYGLWVKITRGTSVAEAFYGDSTGTQVCLDGPASIGDTNTGVVTITFDDACGSATGAVDCTAAASVLSFRISHPQVGVLKIQTDPSPAGIATTSTVSCDCGTLSTVGDSFTARFFRQNENAGNFRDMTTTGTHTPVPSAVTNATTVVGDLNKPFSQCRSGVFYQGVEAINLTLSNGSGANLRVIEVIVAHCEVSSDCACP